MDAPTTPIPLWDSCRIALERSGKLARSGATVFFTFREHLEHAPARAPPCFSYTESVWSARPLGRRRVFHPTRNLETPSRKSKNQGRFFLVNFLFATKAKTTLLSIWGDQPDFKLAKHIPRTTRHGSAGVKFSVFRYFWPSKRGGTKTESPKLVFGSK